MGKGNAAGGSDIPVTEKSLLIIAVIELIVGLGSIAYFLYVLIRKPFVPDEDIKNLKCLCKKYENMKFSEFKDQTKLLNILLGLLWLVRGLVALGMGAILVLGLKTKNRKFLSVNTMCALVQLTLIVLVSNIIMFQIEARGFPVMDNVFYEFFIILAMAGGLIQVKTYMAEMPNSGKRRNQNERGNPNAVYGMPSPSAEQLHTHTPSPYSSPSHNEMPKMSTTDETEEPTTDPSEPAPPKEVSKGRKSKKKKGKKGSKSSKKSKKR